MNKNKLFNKLSFGTSILLLCFFVLNAWADEAGNSDATLDKFNSDKVISDSTPPAYVTSYFDVKNHPPKEQANHYIGVNFGLNANSFTFDQVQSGISLLSDNLSADNVFTSLTFGFGKKVLDDNMYVGLEFDAFANFADYERKDQNNSLTVKMPFGGGVYFVPGFNITKDTMLYLKLGGSLSDFETDTNSQAFYNINSFSDLLFAASVGVGVQTYLNESFSINIDYLFSYYTDAKDTYAATVVENKISPITNQVSLGFAYHF